MKLYDVIRKDEKEKGIVDQQPEPEKYWVRKEEKRNFPTFKRVFIVIGIIVAIILIYIGGILFAHATVTVHEKQIPFSLQQEQLDLENSTTASPGRLSFQTMVVSDSVSRQVFASAMTTSTTKATGEAVLFNQYSTKSQTVRSGTTITGANGKTYTTQSTVSVPGYTGTGTKKVPGSARVSFIATNVGPTYNSSGTTFTVSGWSGANAKLFYGSSAGAITGGQNGAMNTLSDTDKQQALATLQAALTEKLSRETRAQIPANLVTFPDLQFTTLDANSLDITGATVEFAATLTGNMVSYLIPRDLLEQTIAVKADSGHVYSKVIIPALGGIQVEPMGSLPVDPKNIPASISVSATGQGVVIPQVTVSSIQQALSGVRTSSFEGIISAKPEIQNASYTVFPFWVTTFPSQQSRIKVIIQ